MNVAETPRCPATIAAPGWGIGRCAKPKGHGGQHDGVRWYEIEQMATGAVVNEGDSR